MSIPLCYDGVIGLTRKNDVCLDDYLAEYSESDSGLYLDELQGMNLRILNATGGSYGIWEKMTNAVTNAVTAFKTDIMERILKTKEPARSKFYGDIGGKSFSSILSHTDTYFGLRMYADIAGGSWTLRGISFALNTTENITVDIYSGQWDEDGATPVYSITTNSAGGNITSLAGRLKYNEITPIQLSLDGDYYFLYQSAGSPYNNKLTCNCGGHRWCFNTEHPCYNPSRDRWTEWAMVAGVRGDDLTIREDWSTSREAMGMILHGDFGCDTLSMLCSDHSDWTENYIDAAIAHALWFKAGSFLSAYIMDSEEVGRYTLLGLEGLTANMTYYDERYGIMLDYIAEHIELDRTECLKCKSPGGFRRQTQML